MMKLTKEDFKMLPDWVSQSSFTVSFFEWLMEEALLPWECADSSVVKVMQKNCYFLYGSKRKGRVLDIGKSLEFAGIFNRNDYGLYDLKEPLRRLLEIPDTVYVPQKADALKTAQNIASQKAAQMVGRGWEETVRLSGCEKRQLIPMVSRKEIRKCAEGYYREGKTEKEIHFKPEVPVADYFSDSCYLLYLMHKERVAEKIAKQWVLSNAASISRQKIWYGCVRNEFREIMKESEKKKRI